MRMSFENVSPKKFASLEKMLSSKSNKYFKNDEDEEKNENEEDIIKIENIKGNFKCRLSFDLIFPEYVPGFRKPPRAYSVPNRVVTRFLLIKILDILNIFPAGKYPLS